MFKRYNRKAVRAKTQRRVRRKVFGTSERPRLCVFKSLNHIYAQLIDDFNGHTIAAVSTLDPQMRSLGAGGHKEAAKKVGALIAQKAQEKGIRSVVFDRNGFRYQGRVAQLAEGARENGLEF